jgi:hypothetical protein
VPDPTSSISDWSIRLPTNIQTELTTQRLMLTFSGITLSDSENSSRLYLSPGK